MAKRGRKSKYESNVEPQLDRIPKWRRDGLTEAQVANRLGVAVSTFGEYKNSYPELMAALKKGKEELIEEIEDSLYKRALGYDYEEVQQTVEKNGEKETKKVVKIKKHAIPDVGAIAFSLKNLAPDKWKDRHDIDMQGSLQSQNKHIIEERLLNDEEGKRLLKELFRHSNSMASISKE